jgi:hypothetical protein
LRRVLCLIVTASITLGFCTPVQAQSAVTVSDTGVDYSFGEEITFTARAFGSSLSQMDQQWWQEALGENVGGLAIRNLLPYLVVLVVILAFPAWGFWATRKRSKA